MIRFLPLKIECDLFPFDADRIAEEDRNVAWEINDSLYSITRYGEDFGAAVQLFDFSTAQSDELQRLKPLQPDMTSLPTPEHVAQVTAYTSAVWDVRAQRQIYDRWHFIAARDGAVTIFNFGRSMEGIRASLRKCPSLNAIIDQDALSASTRMLRDRFPRFDGMRHTVAHAAEFSHTEEARADHAAGNLFISSSLFGREFTATFDGKVVSYEISMDSFEVLKAVALMFISAFRPAVNPFFLRAQESYEQLKRS